MDPSFQSSTVPKAFIRDGLFSPKRGWIKNPKSATKKVRIFFLENHKKK